MIPGSSSHLALCKLRLDVWPCLALSSITEQVHDDGTLGNSLVHLEKVCAWDPAVLYSLFPACTILSHSNDDIKTIIPQVKTLTVSLRAVADKCKSVVLEIVL